VVAVACHSASKLPLLELRGCELTEDYLVQNGFRRPIIVRCKDGLDLCVPHEQFSIADVRDHVGMLHSVQFTVIFTLKMTSFVCNKMTQNVVNIMLML